MLWICRGCTCAYSVGAPRCPQCGANDPQEEGMPKITRLGGVSDATAQPIEVHGEVVDGPPGEREPLPEFDPTVERVVEPAEQEATGDETGQPEPFDPGEHTVIEVLAYLGEADDAERQRVLNVETAGKNRRGIVGEQA